MLSIAPGRRRRIQGPAPGAFDFVITDLEMPGLDGIELGRQLRAFSPTTKILLATGSGILTATEAVERGFCGLLGENHSFPRPWKTPSSLPG